MFVRGISKNASSKNIFGAYFKVPNKGPEEILPKFVKQTHSFYLYPSQSSLTTKYQSFVYHITHSIWYFNEVCGRKTRRSYYPVSWVEGFRLEAKDCPVGDMIPVLWMGETKWVVVGVTQGLLQYTFHSFRALKFAHWQNSFGLKTSIGTF